VPIAAFLADTVDVQRDQFLRVNNIKPLPRGLVTELLPQISAPLPRRMAAKKIPSALVDVLNQRDDSPFRGLVRRASTPEEGRALAVITDTSLVKAIEESLNSTSGCLFPFRDLASGETDIDGVLLTLLTYWSAVRDEFSEAWGLPTTHSRLMHGVGIRSMGRLMDRVMPTIDLRSDHALDQVRADLALVSPVCRWTSGTWETLGWDWNEPQNTTRHINTLSNFLIRAYLTARQDVS
jgi:DGQHR domain-containing protein